MNRRILNGRLAAGLIVGFVLLAGGVHLLHGMQNKRTAVSLRDRADRAENEGRLDRAEDYLGRYLAYRPTDVDGLGHYAEILERRADTVESRQRIIALYEKAIRLGPDRAKIRRHLAELEVADERFSEAKVHAEVLLAADPRDAQTAILLGRCEEGTGRPREAAALYDRALAAQPTRIEAYLRLADVLRRRLSDPARADAVMDARGEAGGLIASNPRSAEAYLARAGYREVYAVPGVDPSADVTKALELAPDDVNVLQAAARAALARDDTAKARGLLEHAVKLHPGIAALYASLAELERGAGQADRAADWLRRGGEAVPGGAGNERALLRWTLAEMLIQSGKTADAETVIAALRGDNVRPELIEYLKAGSLAARGRFADAARILADLTPSLGALTKFRPLTKRALLLLARCYEQSGNTDQRLDACRRAVAIDLDPDPMRTTARFALAAALVAMDKIDEALDAYRRIANDADASLAIARLQILQNLRRPDEQKQWEDVGRTLDSVEQAITGRGDAGRAAAAVAVLRAESLAVQGRLDQARALLDQALAKQPDQVEVWVALANLVGRGERPVEALTILGDAEKRLGDKVELRVAGAGYWARVGGEGAPAALAKLESGSDKFDEEGRVSLLRELAVAQARIGKDRESYRLWRELAVRRPDDLNVRLTLFDLAVQTKDRAAARSALDAIRRIEGETGSLWKFGHALLLVDQFRDAPKERRLLIEARAELEKVRLLRPSWSRVPIVLAEVAQLDDRPDSAIREYLRAIVEMGDRSPAAIRQAARLLWDRQRFAEADLVLKKLGDDRTPLSGEMQRLSAQVAFRNQDYAHALERAEVVVSDRSADYRDLLWLGQLRWAAGQPAEPLFRRAVALAKDAPEARVALILYLAGNGRKADAEAALDQAEKDLPRDKARLAMARGREIVGQVDRAGELYREALAAQPEDIETLRGAATFHLRNGRPAEAEPLLKRLIDKGGATTDASWARRLLAAVLAGRGGHLQAMQALEVLGLADRTDAHDAGRQEAAAPEDLRSKARILALQPSRARRREATALLEQLNDRGLSQPEDLALLSRLHEADGNWPKARSLLQELLAKRPGDFEASAVYIRALIRHGQSEEASLALTRLESQAPRSPATVEIQARVLHATARDEQAGTLLERYAAEDEGRAEPVARLCEELGLRNLAERLYRLSMERQSSSRPATILALAGFLGRQGRIAEAFDLLGKRAWKTLPDAEVSGAALAILYGSSGRDTAEIEKLGRQLEQAVRDDPKTLSLRFDLANLRCLEGRYDEAEAIFRDIADRNKTLGSPLNNLAWMLALRGGNRAAEALKLVGRAIELEGETPDLLDTRGIAQLALERPEPAARDLEDAVAVSPTADKYFHLARAYLTSGRRGDAERAMREAESKGLKAASLHPLEQETYRQMAGEFKRR